MARMAAVLRQRDEVILMEALEQASGAATGIVRRRRVDQGRLQRILIVESHGEQARDEKARSGHSGRALARSEEQTSELQSLMRISYAVCCLKKKNQHKLQSLMSI